jgi:hypothetical protein
MHHVDEMGSVALRRRNQHTVFSTALPAEPIEGAVVGGLVQPGGPS